MQRKQVRRKWNLDLLRFIAPFGVFSVRSSWLDEIGTFPALYESLGVSTKGNVNVFGICFIVARVQS